MSEATTSTIRSGIDAAFRQARLDKDERTKQVIGMLKSKLMVELKAGTGAVEDDALWLKVLNAYAKELKKTIAAYEEAGARGADALDDLRFEAAFVERWLPKRLDAAATEALVRRVATELGVTDPKQAGKLTGAIMKAHREEVDPDLLKAAVTTVLAS